MSNDVKNFCNITVDETMVKSETGKSDNAKVRTLRNLDPRKIYAKAITVDEVQTIVTLI